MFIGEYNHNIDSKGRVILPAKFRDILGDCFYITKGNDGCLFVYTTEGWEKLQEKLSKLPLTNPANSLKVWDNVILPLLSGTHSIAPEV